MDKSCPLCGEIPTLFVLDGGSSQCKCGYRFFTCRECGVKRDSRLSGKVGICDDCNRICKNCNSPKQPNDCNCESCRKVMYTTCQVCNESKSYHENNNMMHEYTT